MKCCSLETNYSSSRNIFRRWCRVCERLIEVGATHAVIDEDFRNENSDSETELTYLSIVVHLKLVIASDWEP